MACAGLLGRRGTSHEEFNVPLVGVEVAAEVRDFVAEVKVRQYYRNKNALDDIEAIYHFPLDEASCVCGFQAEYEDGTIVRGVVKEKEEARKEYEAAISAGQQAQLLEEVRPDIFTISVGRLPRGAHVAIQIIYITTLKAEGSSSRFFLPLHVAERYTPMNSGNLESGPLPAIPTSMVPYYRLAVTIVYHTRSRIVKVSSPSHPADLFVAMQDRKCEATVSNIALNKELVVLCEEARAHDPRACLEIANDGSMVGLVTLFPKIEFRDVEREIIFGIDRSGSMSMSGAGSRLGSKSQIENAKEALLLFLRALPPSCTFNVVGFGSDFKPLFPSSRPYTDESLAVATSYAEQLQADMGGTELLGPLQFCLDPETEAAFGVNRQTVLQCPGLHALSAMPAPQGGWTCNVCGRGVEEGERLVGCRTCDWDACSLCLFGCKGRHQLMPATSHSATMYCDVCTRGLMLGESTLSCRLCDYDVCLSCYEEHTGRKERAEALRKRCCPGRHALCVVECAGEWECSVCKGMQEAGWKKAGCEACSWAACEVCLFGCKGQHELRAQTVTNDAAFCDVCRKGLTRGEEGVMGCRVCDWDACRGCYEMVQTRRSLNVRRRQRQVFVLTDGQIFNEQQVFDLVRSKCSHPSPTSVTSPPAPAPSPARVFALGIGDGVSHHLVEGLARHGRGTAEFVTDAATLRSKVLRQLKQSLQPALDSVAVTWTYPPTTTSQPPPAHTLPPALSASSSFPTTGGEGSGVVGASSSSSTSAAVVEAAIRYVPTVVPPVFNGHRFLAMALLPKGHVLLPLSVTVTALSPDGPLETTLPLEPEEILRGDIAHRLAARMRIRELEESTKAKPPPLCAPPVQTPAERENDEPRRAEIVALALRHGLASTLTSFVATRTSRDGATHTLLVQRRTVVQHSSSSFASSFGTSSFGSSSFGSSSGAAFGSASTAFGSSSQPTLSAGSGGFGFAVAGSAPVAVATVNVGGGEGGLVRLCMLQRADGSFVCDERLASALRCDLCALNAAVSGVLRGKTGAEEAVVVGTVAAVVGLRVVFEEQREEWELIGDKAMRVLEGMGIGEQEVNACVEKLQGLITGT